MMDKTNRKRTTIYIDNETLEIIDAISKKYEISRSATIRMIFRKYKKEEW